MAGIVRNRIDNTLLDYETFVKLTKHCIADAEKASGDLFGVDHPLHDKHIMVLAISNMCNKFGFNNAFPVHFPPGYLPPEAVLELRTISDLRKANKMLKVAQGRQAA